MTQKSKPKQNLPKVKPLTDEEVMKHARRALDNILKFEETEPPERHLVKIQQKT